MIWHLILKPIYMLLWGNRRAQRIEDAWQQANDERVREAGRRWDIEHQTTHQVWRHAAQVEATRERNGS